MSDNLIKIDANSNICDSRIAINKNFAVLSKKLTNIDNIVFNNINSKINELSKDNEFIEKVSENFARIAMTGKYEDLKNIDEFKDNIYGDFVKKLSKIATSGDYNDLKNIDEFKELLKKTICDYFIETYFGFDIEENETIDKFVESKILDIYYNENKVIRYTSDSKLENIRFNEDNTIKSHNFYNGTGLIFFDKDVTSIGTSAFSGCSSLTSITIPNSVTSIGGSAFEGCSSLTSITIPNSVTIIWGSAFSGCTSLKSVILGDSVIDIEGSAFSGCENLNFIKLPYSIVYVDNYAFIDCKNINTIVYGGTMNGWENLANNNNFNHFNMTLLLAKNIACLDGEYNKNHSIVE